VNYFCRNNFDLYSHTPTLESFFAHPIAQCSEDLIFVFDIHKKKVLGCNPACENVTACTESPFNLINPPQEEIFAKLQADISEGDKCIRQEVIFTTKDRKKIPMIMRAMPFQTNSEKNLIWCFSLTNNQEKTGLEETIKAHATNLEELAFLTSHEIRHEYVKLQAILKAFSEDLELPVNLKQLLSLGEQSIDKINRAIYKMNNRVTFSQQQLMKRPGKVASGNYRHLVLIDDDELTLLLNKRMLEEIGLSSEIHTFSVPDRAINWLKNQTNSDEILLFLDLNMPEKTGWEVLEQLEVERLSPDVVILTSSINKQDANRATSHETVVSYVTKPLTIEAVQLVLASA
jgi:CheY-like chemotaxis protein